MFDKLEKSQFLYISNKFSAYFGGNPGLAEFNIAEVIRPVSFILLLKKRNNFFRNVPVCHHAADNRNLLLFWK